MTHESMERELRARYIFACVVERKTLSILDPQDVLGSTAKGT